MWPCVYVGRLLVAQWAEDGWKDFGPKDMFSVVSHILSVSKFKGLGDVCLGYLRIIPKCICEFVVQCII